jgi:hypothetical protein
VLRVLSIVNLAMWTVLFLAWVPYTIAVGVNDPASVEVRWILASTWLLMMLLVVLRIRRRRPVLG